MKSCLDGNGNNVTQALLNYMAARQPLWTSELYQLRAPRSVDTPFAAALLLTDWSSALIWSHIGTFKAAVIKHSPIETVVGLEAQEVVLDWSLGNSMLLFASDGTTPLESYYTAFREGLYDHGLVRIWRTYMPAPGNANGFGAVMQYQGRIGDITTDSLGIHISVTSLLEVLNRKLPPNVIQSANYNAAWLLATAPVTMVLQAGSTPTQLRATVQGAPTQIFEAGHFRFGHIYFPPPAAAGQLAGHYRQVQDSFVSEGVNIIQLFEPLPFPPNVNASLGLTSSGEIFQAYVAHPQGSQANDTSQPGYPQFLGFGHVPRPEDSI